jgi:hypothetical protein
MCHLSTFVRMWIEREVRERTGHGIADTQIQDASHVLAAVAKLRGAA